VEKVVRGRIAVPRGRAPTPARARLVALVGGHFARHRILTVTASAGSGKTTAVIDALAGDGSIAWLTLDRSDISAGRFLTYLEAALSQAGVTSFVSATEALGRGVGHAEAAALLAEAVGDSPSVLVLDELERIAESPTTLAAVTNFVRYAPSTLRIVLISRHSIMLDLAHEESGGQIGHIGESDLALTVDEARVILSALSHADVDAATAVQATGGWLTGVVHEAWRSREHVHGSGGEADPLHTYLSSEIMTSLPASVQEFLIATSVLDDVTLLRADALGRGDAADAFADLRQRHLPIDFIDASWFRCHTRFREYLQEQLRLAAPQLQREVHGAYAELLASEHRHEEAVDAFLLAGDIPRAERSADGVILAVARRSDFDIVAGWLTRFRRAVVESSVPMTAVELLMALEREEYGVGADCADRLLALAGAPGAQHLDHGLLADIAWCFFLTDRIDDAWALIADVDGDARSDLMRFAIGVELIDNPLHYRDRPAESGTELDGFLARVDLAHGRFERLISAPDRTFDAVRLAKVGALTGLGRLEDATALLADISASGWTEVRRTAELSAECGRPEEAWASLIAGRDRLARSGSPLYRMFALLTEAMLALRYSHDVPLATAALDATEKIQSSSRRVRVLEQLLLWRGLIGLLERDDDKAVEHLRGAVGVMARHDRLLNLSTAAIYLAEAEWRLGNEAAADAAADLAIDTAHRTGSLHTVVLALREFPAVLSRRLDAELDADSDWHALGRAILAQSSHRLHVRPAEVRVVEFGELGATLDGRRVDIRLTKGIELLSYLAWNDGSAPREQVIANLFEGKTEKSTDSYLRIAIKAVRGILGQDSISADARTIAWGHEGLTSDSTALWATLQRVRNVDRRHRLQLAMDALNGVPEGEFLPGAKSTWALGQRARWSVMVIDLRHAAADAAFEVDDHRLAQRLIDSVLDADPYRERGWRLAMRIAGSMGDGDAVIARYRSCAAHLAELGTAPSDSTTRLLHLLRA
jgi:DNA-binding SARP family transcriptional activator